MIFRNKECTQSSGWIYASLKFLASQQINWTDNLTEFSAVEKHGWFYNESRLEKEGTIYQPLRSGRIWHKVNF